MDLDETKKRKIDQTEMMDVEAVLKTHLESTQNLLKIIAALTQKIVGFERVFNKDLFKST